MTISGAHRSGVSLKTLRKVVYLRCLHNSDMSLAYHDVY